MNITYRGAPLADNPIFFANSFPKSGTHLLTQVLKGFTRIGSVVDSGLPAIVTFEGKSGRKRSENEIMQDLKRLLPGDIGYGHVHALPRAVSFLSKDGVTAYFILRDPRDVVVSHVHYITDIKTDHIHHRYYQEALTNFDERLQASIEGVPSVKCQVSSVEIAPNSLDEVVSHTSPLPSSSAPNSRPFTPFRASLPNIWERFEPYMGWLDHPEVLVLHYEDFILDQREAARRVFDHAVARGFTATCDHETASQILAESIDPASSPTFREGKTGGWRDAFTDQHKQLFKKVTGDLLLRLGYESNNAW